MHTSKIKVLGKFVLLAFMATWVFGCKNSSEKTVSNSIEKDSTAVVAPTNLKWSERMVLTVMHENPEPWEVSFGNRKYWNYTDGLVLKGIEKVYKLTGEKKYHDFVKKYVDASKEGIDTYNIEDYNIDMINSGNLLFDLYEETKDTSYLSTMKLLRKQLEDQPRTKSGGFWHKKIYPNQMWLDGLYMGEPFYAHYTMLFEAGEKLDDIVHQFDLIQQHTIDPNTGLLFHGWDESKQMEWADKKTGVSPNFWSRSLGWYMMALVDVLDYFPEGHSGHAKLVGYLKDLSASLLKFQDPSGLWYQVPNMGDKEGNYLEASGSLMFIYAFEKGAKKGYLPAEYSKRANNAFDGVIDQLVTVGEDGEILLSGICTSAGLGGDPYRDGSFEYYVTTKQAVNDPHGTGPFILASAELNR